MFKPETIDPSLLAFTKLIDDSISAKRLAQPKRQYLGASTWGEPCDRKLAYSYHQTPNDPDRFFSPNVLRIFDMGHDGEERMGEYLKLAGFDVHTLKPDGKQYGFEAADGKLKGHIDGVIISGPEIPGLKYPCLWENKALNDKSWNDTAKKGVRVSKPLYYAQANTYMAYLDLECALFTFQNRNSGEIACEVLQLDARNAQESSDRAVRVIKCTTPEEMPRIGIDSTDFRCKFCDYRRRCWDIVDIAPASTPDITSPSWLKKE
jgi:hypothetical protein